MLIRLLILASFGIGTIAAAAPGDWRHDGVDRVVALSDVHGAYDSMVRTLQQAGIIDDTLAWSGGAAHLVIVGDLLDRGPKSREAMDLLMRLEGEAAAANGRVHVLLGNHEAMNLTGDLRYVSREEYAAFAGDETAEQRSRWFDVWAARRGDTDREVLLAEFDDKFPPGFFAHRAAFGAGGEYGRWLLEKPIIVVINGTAFVHAGLSPAVAEYGLDGVNETLVADLRDQLAAIDMLEKAGLLMPGDAPWERLPLLEASDRAFSEETEAAVATLERTSQSELHASDGPLWYRGNVYCPTLVEDDRLDTTLAAIGATRVVIGHTPTPDRVVMQRLGGKVIEVDTGMLGSYYGGRGHALIMSGGALGAISEDSAELLPPKQHPRRVGARPGDSLTAADLEQLLSHGEVSVVGEDEDGRNIVSVSDGEHTVEALFEERVGRANYPDVAAYRLDRLLGLDLVPVAVVREVDGEAGSLQFLPADWIDEDQRVETRGGAGATCPLDQQWGGMYLFDALIRNEGRSRARMLYSPDVWQLLLVDHEDAFGSRKTFPRHLENAPIEVGEAWKEALARLDSDLLEEKLGDVLDERRRDALLARRDELVSRY